VDRSAVSKSSRDFHECFKHSVLDDRALANPVSLHYCFKHHMALHLLIKAPWRGSKINLMNYVLKPIYYLVGLLSIPPAVLLRRPKSFIAPSIVANQFSPESTLLSLWLLMRRLHAPLPGQVSDVSHLEAPTFDETSKTKGDD